MKIEQEYYGVVTVGTGTNSPKELKITEYIRGEYKDHRMASVSVLEDDTFIIGIENYQSSGRSSQTMRLSKESLLGILSISMLYLKVKDWDFVTELEKALGNTDEINYECSGNLTDKSK